MFLDDDEIEEKIKMKEKEKYKSILIWLMDNLLEAKENYLDMICRAIGEFGSLLESIKTEKTKKGTYEHKIRGVFRY